MPAPEQDGFEVDLLIEKGKKWDERTGEGAIASYNGSIVFAPPGAKPGQRARLNLFVIKDAQGQPKRDNSWEKKIMYQAKPAHDDKESHVRWLQNADGTISLVECTWDWLWQLKKLRVLETRQPAQKEERETYLQPTYKLVWGSDETSTCLQKITTPIIHTKVEAVVEEWHGPGDDCMGWAIIASRKEPDIVVDVPFTTIHVSPTYRGDDMLVTHPSDMGTRIAVYTQTPELKSQGGVWGCQMKWGDIPRFAQEQFLQHFPVCSCGRERYSISHSREQFGDEYAKCDICRSEESCQRCGRQLDEDKPLKIRLIDGWLVCSACQPQLVLEQLVHKHVPVERRKAVSEQAVALLACKIPLSQENGEMVFKLRLDHISDSYARGQVEAKGSGFVWYYITQTGTYASKFSPEALQFLQYYGQAQGNGLVLLTAWLIGRSHKVEDCGNDFYYRTQVKGESLEPSFTASEFSADLSVAVQLCGTESDRQKATIGYQRLVEVLGEEAEEAMAVREVLGGLKQDYALAIKKIEEGNEACRRKEEQERRRAETEERLPQLLSEHYPNCPLCEQRVNWGKIELKHAFTDTGACFCDCLRKNPPIPKVAEAIEAFNEGFGYVRDTIGNNITANVIRDTYAAGQTVVELLAYHKYGQWYLSIKINSSAFGAGEWKSQAAWVLPNSKQRKLFELCRLRESYQQQIAQAEADFVAKERILKLQFHRETRDGKEQWVSGSRKGGLVYVVDREREKSVVEGKQYYCFLGRTLVDNERIRVYVVQPYLQIGRDIDAEIAQCEAELQSEKVSVSSPVSEPSSKQPAPKTTGSTTVAVDKLSGLFGGNRARITKKR